MYNIESTTGQSITAMIRDALIRLQLPIENLRSQTYDEVANMAVKFHGCQAEETTAVSSFHKLWCSCHVVSKAVQETIDKRDALDHIHKLSKL